ncbi:hypothetical protein R5W24_004439 [Gemmata sp. JC717]|uniref:hypothetical protein n=1 Tax=Gemmata algarum TaxID=2975278 RepID=UPI0021BB09A4|nr:hypothetical protein [Gemmata algarum]MDY3555298.1 hypothetical protein [Gemmata algarum]
MSLRDHQRRTADRKAAGVDQTYPHHRGRAASAGARTSLPLLTRGPCHHETGAVLEYCTTCNEEARHVRGCDLHERCTRGYVSDKVQACDRCPQYTAAEREGDPRCGVAIGSYLWPELVELQIRLIRATCGPVPVLVSNDHPESAAALLAIAAAHPDVTLATSPERLGHTGGDLAVYHRGAKWAAERGLSVVAKLSQRLLLTRPYWLQDGARDLLASGLPIATRAATGPTGAPRYPIRTEYALLDVSRWNAPEILAAVAPGRYWHQREGGWPAEQVIDELIRAQLVAYLPAALLPTTREERAPGVVWHHSDPREAYDALARQFGVALPADFHTGGWEREYAAGQYSYG